jgi:hypothetical protein
MSTTSPYDVVKEKDDPEAYQTLTQAYLEWVHDPKCDTKYNKVVQVGNEQRQVTFMRDDSIGDPKKPDEEDKPNVQEISTTEGTDIFFPVYYFHSSIGESGCKTLEDCMKAAKDDLSKIRTDNNGNQKIYAEVSINGKNKAITSNFNDHTVTNSSLNMTVGDNRLNREPEFHLKPGTYQGVVRGTFMYLRNFKKGEYVLKFGGEASNFTTHSEYTMHVK